MFHYIISHYITFHIYWSTRLKVTAIHQDSHFIYLHIELHHFTLLHYVTVHIYWSPRVKVTAIHQDSLFIYLYFIYNNLCFFTLLYIISCYITHILITSATRDRNNVLSQSLIEKSWAFKGCRTMTIFGLI